MAWFTDLGLNDALKRIKVLEKDLDPLTAEEKEALFCVLNNALKCVLNDALKCVLNDALKRVEVLEKEVDLLKRGICEFS